MRVVYILKSKKDSKLYIGSTNDLKRRLSQHNSGTVPATKGRQPFELIYFECYKSIDDAYHREHNLKLQSNALSQLKKRLKKSLI